MLEKAYFCDMSTIPFRHFVATPLGWMLLQGENNELFSLHFVDESLMRSFIQLESLSPPPAFVVKTEAWLRAYFDWQPLPPLPRLMMRGSEFQIAVWQEAMKVPLGQTISYAALASQVAVRLGRPFPAVRAVGAALGANPFLLLVPCHRIIRSNGELGGFAAGLSRKRHLLAHERVWLGEQQRQEEPLLFG